jgi:Rod binding domain-containing protein
MLRGVSDSSDWGRSKLLPNGDSSDWGRSKLLPNGEPIRRGCGSADIPALQGACQDFEGLFLSMLFRAMKSTVPKDALLSGGTAGELFESMWADQVGSLSARSSPLRIADMVFSALGKDSHG